jgi:hypothetical protein
MLRGHGEESHVKNQEIKSFNPVVRDISSLVELSDESLNQVIGGVALDVVSDCPDNRACEPDCRCNSACTNLA